MLDCDGSFAKSLNVDNLKKELRIRNLSMKGKKVDLQNRLIAAIEKDVSSSEVNHLYQYKLSKENKECISKVEFDTFAKDFTEFKQFTSDNIMRMNTSKENKEFISKVDFDIFAQDFIEFKQFTYDNIIRMNAEIKEKCLTNKKSAIASAIEDENCYLKQELKNKQSIIDLLMEDLKYLKSITIVQPNSLNHTDIDTIQQKIYQHVDVNKDKIDELEWQHNDSLSKQLKSTSNMLQTKKAKMKDFLISNNRFEVLEIEDEPNQEIMVDNRNNNSVPVPHVNKNHVPINVRNNKSLMKNGMVVDEFPGRNINSFRESKTQTFHGKSKKITVFGDSLVKRIRGVELSKRVKSGSTFIKSFPGANAKELTHYVVPTLVEQSPDAVIVHVGSNNISRMNRNSTTQRNIDIAKEIIETGLTCREKGVKEVFISSLLCRSGNEEMNKVNEINNILKQRCLSENFIFISNEDIRREHLWKDGIHLLDVGTDILSQNFINALNENLL